MRNTGAQAFVIFINTLFYIIEKYKKIKQKQVVKAPEMCLLNKQCSVFFIYTFLKATGRDYF